MTLPTPSENHEVSVYFIFFIRFSHIIGQYVDIDHDI